jgi:hypothetical protein
MPAHYSQVFTMTDRDLWLAVRRALLIIVRAIERRYGLDTGERQEATESHTLVASGRPR